MALIKNSKMKSILNTKSEISENYWSTVISVLVIYVSNASLSDEKIIMISMNP